MFVDGFMNVKLGEIFEIGSGGTPSKKNPEYYNGNIPWIKTGDLKEKYLYKSEDYITELGLNNSSAKMCEPDTVLIAMYGATIGATSILKIPACTNQACATFKKSDKITPEFLYYFFRSQKERFVKDGVGGAQPNISAGYLKKIEIELLPLKKQNEITNTLDKLQSIVTHIRTQLEKLDLLVKARFVEMFGEPVHNTFQLPTMPMTNICEIIDGDRGKNYPKQEEFFSKEYCLFLNAKNVTKYGFNFSECLFITKEKDAILRKGKLQRGDVVLTTRGTLGNLAFYTKEIPFENIRINSGMVILRMNREVINETFFIEQFRMQVDDIKQSIASGSAQPQLPISTMNKINIITPELELQTQFADFVKQVDQSKSILQQELTQTQTLFDSLMQEYFG